MQILYGGKTDRCHPNMYHNPSKWRVCNQIYQVLPYIIKAIIEQMGISNQIAMVSFDVFKGQTTAAIYNQLEENGIVYMTIPNGCTDKLQPLDVSVNKSYLTEKFET